MPEVPEYLDDGEWFHGSPLVLDCLAAGSTITRCRAVAEAFSHKPTLVSFDVQEDPPRLGSVYHNGSRHGYLYVVSVEQEDDVRPHPNSSFPQGVEWLTTRALTLRWVASVPAEHQYRPLSYPHRTGPEGSDKERSGCGSG